MINLHLRRIKLPRRGAVSLEFLLNFVIYFVVFLFLFNLAIIPIKIFYLKIVARDTAILYTQLIHFYGATDLPSQAYYIMGEEFPKDNLNSMKLRFQFVKVGYNKTIESVKVEGSCRKDVANVVSYYITKNLFKEGTLSSLLFDPTRITINIEDTGCPQGDNLSEKVLDWVSDFFKGIFFTFNVTVKVEYPIYIFELVNLNLVGVNKKIQGSFSIDYNK